MKTANNTYKKKSHVPRSGGIAEVEPTSSGNTLIQIGEFRFIVLDFFCTNEDG